MTDAGARVRYEFDGFQLDIQQRLLMTGAERRPVPLPPMIFGTLLYRVERRGELLDESLARFAQLDMLGGAWGFFWMREMTPFRRHASFAGIIERFALMPYWERFGPPDGHELRRGKLVVS